MKIQFFIVPMLLGLGAAQGGSLNQTLPATLLADAEDDTKVVQALIDAMPEGGSLHLPAGTLTLSAPLVIDRKNFAIVGRDANLTAIRWLKAQDGLIFQTSKSDGGSVRVADVTLLGTAENSGAAIRGVAVGGHEPPKINLDRVRVEGAGTGYWRYGLKLERGEALLVDCNFQGVNRGDRGTQALIDYSGKTGGGGRIQTARCRLSGARKGVAVHDTDSEGQKFYDTIVEDVVIGAERLTSEPTFSWMGSRISAEQNVFYFSGVRDTEIAGCLFEASAPKATTIVLERRQTQHISFVGNLIIGAKLLAVNSQDFEGKPSTLVKSVSLSGNYLQGGKIAFDLSGPETKEFALGGNVMQGVQQEFVLAPDGKQIMKTKTEESKP